MFGKIALTKGKELPLVITYSPSIGFFIGTEILVDDRMKSFTKESIECWDTKAEADKAFQDNTWEQAVVSNIDKF